LILWQ